VDLGYKVRREQMNRVGQSTVLVAGNMVAKLCQIVNEMGRNILIIENAGHNIIL
jgi:hypothetical protein